MRTAHCVPGIACVHCARACLIYLDCACWAALHQCVTGSVSATILGAGAGGGRITVVRFCAGGTITVTGGTVGNGVLVGCTVTVGNGIAVSVGSGVIVGSTVTLNLAPSWPCGGIWQLVSESSWHGSSGCAAIADGTITAVSETPMMPAAKMTRFRKRKRSLLRWTDVHSAMPAAAATAAEVVMG